MSVEETRSEILRLIARVNEADGRGGRKTRRGAPGGASGATGGAREDAQLRARRLKLARLKEQRERLASTLAKTPLVDRVSALERRVDRVEHQLGGAGAGGQKSGPVSAAGSSAVPAGSVFGGMIRETMLGDMLQLVTSQGMSGVFGVSDGEREILLYFHEGEIHHATGAGTEGEDAVFAAMAIQEGTYYFKESTDLPDDRTINANTQFLILEALRRIDEESAGGGE